MRSVEPIYSGRIIRSYWAEVIEAVSANLPLKRNGQFEVLTQKPHHLDSPLFRNFNLFVRFGVFDIAPQNLLGERQIRS